MVRCSQSATGRGLKQLDYIAGWVFQKDLRSSRARDDVVPKFETARAQLVDLGLQIGHNQLKTVPAPRHRPLAVWHCTTG